MEKITHIAQCVLDKRTTQINSLQEKLYSILIFTDPAEEVYFIQDTQKQLQSIRAFLEKYIVIEKPATRYGNHFHHQQRGHVASNVELASFQEEQLLQIIENYYESVGYFVDTYGDR